MAPRTPKTSTPSTERFVSRVLQQTAHVRRHLPRIAALEAELDAASDRLREARLNYERQALQDYPPKISVATEHKLLAKIEEAYQDRKRVLAALDVAERDTSTRLYKAARRLARP